MQIDESREIFCLTADETKLLGRPVTDNVWPFSRAGDLLTAVLAARGRIATRYIELADYPYGSARIGAEVGLNTQAANLAIMLEEISPHLGSVAAGAEAFLQDQD